MKAYVLALALVAQTEGIRINAISSDDAATPSAAPAYNDGNHKNVGFTRDNYVKDAPKQEAKGTGHPEYEGVVHGRSK